MRKIKLFCIPYAGGSANIYKDWNTGLSENIELCPIELAGRGSRIAEELYTNLKEAVDDVFDKIATYTSEFEYAIFGHSMGAFIAYEVIQKIMSLGLKVPQHAFFSGRQPPGTLRIGKAYSTMSPAEFQEAIMDLGGTPPEFFQYSELKKIFIPLLRRDFLISETIVDRSQIIPLKHDISVLVGEDEGIPPDLVDQWNEHTQRKCNIHYVDGDHFFLIDSRDDVISIINSRLNQQNLKRSDSLIDHISK